MVGVREIELNQTYPAVPGSVPSARRAIAKFAAEAGVCLIVPAAFLYAVLLTDS